MMDKAKGGIVRPGVYLISGNAPERTVHRSALRELRARVNDELAEADMGLDRAVEPSGDVPRATHLPLRHREPHSGTFLLLVGLLIGSMCVIGFLIATWPLGHLPPGCTP
jgi:hypothetical protein